MKNAVICKVKTLTIPRIIPSKLYVAWKFNDSKGTSQAYQVQNPTLDLDFEIQLVWDSKKKNQLELALCAEDNFHNKFRLGTDILEIPIKEISENSKDSKTPSHLTLIKTGAGEFTLYSIFKQGTFSIPSVESENLSKINFFISPLEQYHEFVTSLKPFPDTEHPATVLWGDNGLLDMLKDFQKKNLTIDDVRFIAENENILPQKLENTSHLAETFTTAAGLLMTRDPLYITPSGKIGTAQVLVTEKRYPYVAIYILDFLKKHNTDSEVSKNEQILDPLITLICNIICFHETDEQLLLFLLATISVISQYLLLHYNEHYASLIALIQTAKQSGLINYLEFLSSRLNPIVHEQQFIISFLTSVKEDIYLNSLGEIFTNEIITPLLEIVDYSVVNKWIFDSESDTLEMQELKDAYPNYNWPFISSLQIILENPQKIIQKKKFPPQVCSAMRSNFGIYSLIRLANCGKIKASEKEINAVSHDKVNVERPDVDNWCFEHNKTVLEKDFLNHIPELPKT